MADRFTPPAHRRIRGALMGAGTLKTHRENLLILERHPFARLTAGGLWYGLELSDDGKLVMLNAAGGPFMVLHYCCSDCGYLESRARGKYP